MSKFVKIKTTPCPEGTYTVKYENGTVIEAGTVASGGNVTIVVPNP